jgi:hypothetical protein
LSQEWSAGFSEPLDSYHSQHHTRTDGNTVIDVPKDFTRFRRGKRVLIPHVKYLKRYHNKTRNKIHHSQSHHKRPMVGGIVTEKVHTERVTIAH